MNKQTPRYLLLLSLLLLTPSLWTKNFIFDLGGVLIDTNSMASFNKLGKANITECIIRLKLNPFTINSHIKTKFFETLHNIALINFPSTNDQYAIAYDEHGNTLPYIMCAWLNGSLTSSQAHTLCTNTIAANPQWFDCPAQQRVISNLINMIFSPESFIATRKIYKEGIIFITALKNKGHKAYVLSNWDSESFALLQKKYPELFELFDGIIISGDAHALKPSEDIYTTLLDRYNLKAQDCCFIDDQKENIAAAQSLGIDAVICTHQGSALSKKPNFKLIAHTIRELYSKSVTRLEKRNSNGISVSSTKNTSNAIIDGEKISPTDSTI